MGKELEEDYEQTQDQLQMINWTPGNVLGLPSDVNYCSIEADLS